MEDRTRENYNFWLLIEDLVGQKIPNYIKNIMNLNGYGSVNTFKDVTEEDIDNIEEYSRTKLIRLLEKSAMDSGSEFDENVMRSFFRIYAVSPEEFQFVRGDRKLISKLVERVNVKIQTEAQYFTPNSIPKKRQKINFIGISESHFGLIYGDFTQRLNMVSVPVDELKTKLFNSAKSVFESYDIELEGRNCPCLSIDMITVMLGEKVVKGTVMCIICQKQKTKVSLKSNSRTGSSFWIMCNLKAHIQYCLKLPKTEKQNVKEKDHEDIEVHNNYNESNDGKNNSLMNGDLFDDNCDSTIIGLDITPISEIQDDSLRDEYEELVSAQMLLQNVKMTNAVYQSKDEELTINSGFGSTSRPFQFNICDVPADGNCLFSSAAHQISYIKINSAEHEKHTNDLRASVIHHIEQNMSNYVHCLTGRVLDSQKSIKKVSMEECCDFVKNQLVRSGTFGGTESIQAISVMFEINIIVLSEGGTAYFGAMFNPVFKKCIMIAFRGTPNQKNEKRNHYGSVSNVDNKLVKTVSKHLIRNYMKSIQNEKTNSTVTIE